LQIPFKIILGCLFLACVMSKSVLAAAPPLSAGQDLEAQAERFQEEYSIEKRERDKQIKKPSVEVENNNAGIIAPGPTFILNAIHVTGATIFDPAQLQFIWKPYLGKKVDFKSINDIVQMIKRVYKDLGFLTTTAYLPPQDIKDGLVEVRVVEGKRGDLNVEGNQWFSTPSIAKYFHTYRGEALDMGEVQKDLMRLNDNRDLNVTSILSSGKEPETVDVTLKANENLPYHVSIGTDNQGSRLSGRYRRTVVLDDSNLTGNHDNLSINSVFSDLSLGESMSYQTPIGTNGTKLGLDAGYFEAKLGQEYKAYDIVTNTKFYTPNASWELYQSQDAQVNMTSGIKIKDIEKTEGRQKVTEEDLRLPYLGLNAIKSDTMGQTSFSPEVSFGTPGFLGESGSDNPVASRENADRTFFKYDHFISRNQQMPWDSYVQIRSQFQAATHTLPTSEQIQLGGESSVRGYPEGDYLADTGGNLDMDWFFPMYPIPSSWTVMNSDVNLKHQIEPFIFTDMGGGELIQTDTGETKKTFLVGIGGGLRVRIKSNMYLKLEWGVPEGDRPIKGTGPSTFDVSFQAGT